MENIELSKMSRSGGNTRLRSRRWCFTLNNWNDSEYSDIISMSQENKYIIGKECGKEGTPHLQGYIEFKHQKDLSALKKWNSRIHWEQAKGDKDANIKYCSKENDFVSTFEGIEPLEGGVLTEQWQRQLKLQLLEKPDFRKIFWYWSKNGGVGKSCFVRHMLMTEDAALINKGKYSDMINQLYNLKKVPRVVLVDIPRCMSKISWAALEDIKNGCISNSKYETGFKMFNPPHIVVFCNFAPDDSGEIFSDDRIIVVDLDNLEEGISTDK